MAGAEWLANPWAWLLASGLCLGASFGRFVQALVARGRAERRLSARRSSIAALILALAVLGLVGLLVFPPQAAFSDFAFLLAGSTALGIGVLVGLFPRVAGLPLGLLALALVIALSWGLSGWLGTNRARTIATLTPFSVGGGAFSGELAAEEKDGFPLRQELSLPVTEAGLCIERLELEGPLGLLRGSHFYRIAGIVGGTEGATALVADFPLDPPLLDRVLPLGSALDARAELPFARRWREAAKPRLLVALEPLRFALDPGAPAGSGLALEARAGP